MRRFLGFCLDELCRMLPEYKRVYKQATAYHSVLIDVGEILAQCSCNPHADSAVDIIEYALDFKFSRRTTRVSAVPMARLPKRINRE